MTHQQTGEVMVMKELLRFDEETQTTFLKEVCDRCIMFMYRISDFSTGFPLSVTWFTIILGKSDALSGSPKCPEIYWSSLQRQASKLNLGVCARRDFEGNHTENGLNTFLIHDIFFYIWAIYYIFKAIKSVWWNANKQYIFYQLSNRAVIIHGNSE